MSAVAQEVFDLTGVDAAEFGSFEPVPEGIYLMRVTDTSTDPSKGGDPMYTLKLEIVDGEYKGRKFWHRKVPSAKTIKFVKSDVLGLRINVPGKLSGAQLVSYIAKEARGRLVQVSIGFGKDEYANRNEVKGLLPAEGEGGTATSAPTISEDEI